MTQDPAHQQDLPRLLVHETLHVTRGMKIECRLVQALASLLCRMPLNLAYYLAPGFGWLASLHKRYRHVALCNVRTAYGDSMSERAAMKIVRGAFTSLCQSAIEFASLPKLTDAYLKDHVEIRGLENLKRAHDRNKGVILFSAHLGSWELAGSYVARFIHPLAAVMTMQRNPLLNAMVMRRRQDQSIVLIPKPLTHAPLSRFLKANYSVAFIADQYSPHGGVEVNLFGVPTLGARGPVVYAMRTGAPLLPAFAVRSRTDPRQHTLIFEKELALEKSGDLTADIRRSSQKAFDILESYVRQYPEQWLWMHRRWRDIT